MANTLLFVQ